MGNNYIQLNSNNSYSVLYLNEAGSGTYSVVNNIISFNVTSGDDDLTDEDSFKIKRLSATELVLENTDDPSWTLSFTR